MVLCLLSAPFGINNESTQYVLSLQITVELYNDYFLPNLGDFWVGGREGAFFFPFFFSPNFLPQFTNEFLFYSSYGYCINSDCFEIFLAVILKLESFFANVFFFFARLPTCTTDNITN